MTNKKTLGLAIALATIALPAAAQTSPWYTGLNLGQSKTGSELVSNREGTISNATNFASYFDDKDTAWRFFVGWRLNPYISIEANYADYGKTRTDTQFNVPGGPTNFGRIVVDREVKGFGGDLVLTLPIWEQFSIFGRAGYFRAETEAAGQISGDVFFTDGLGGTTRDNTHKENLGKYGVGAEWMFSPNVGARLEWERLPNVGKKFAAGESNTTGEADIDTWSIGVVWRF
ncbi:porin family protein [Usitatibacter palustris]|uniref:Outer membrane protein A n=1 Tax=Usitatibacter palustris TaxID=2732487 RepID=A0A6M4H8H2_9PROT|nr:porin family protein [Usitatibacter palustris]QJR16009.1 Outer membrane protein A [Usitatibacter palustris]